jgi:hypothetical protein
MRVAFFTGRHPGFAGIYGVIVKWWTRGDFSHTELIESVNPDGTANCWSSAYLDKGVRRKTYALPPSDWRFVDVPTTPEQEAQALQWFKDHAGEPYDVRGMFGIALRRLPNYRGKWFCSESVAAALGFSEPWRLDPATLYIALQRADFSGPRN